MFATYTSYTSVLDLQSCTRPNYDEYPLYEVYALR